MRAYRSNTGKAERVDVPGALRGAPAITRLLAASLVAITSACGDAGDLPFVPDTRGATIMARTLDAYIATHQSADAPGLTVLIRKDGRAVYQNSRGLADARTGAEIDDRTAFRLGSVSKPFTALAIMQLVERGQLNLHQSITDLLTELPPRFDDITIHHLLAHQSGLRDYVTENPDLSSLDGVTNAQLLANPDAVGDLEFAPGEGAEYSNTGYLLLAEIVERATGVRFAAYMQTEFFDKLGMTDSYIVDEFRDLGDRGENVALNYARTPEIFGFRSLTHGPGGQVSSAADLSAFLTALKRGLIVSQETLNTMTSTKSSLADLSDYGYGWLTGTGQYWHTGQYSDQADFWHTGGWDGFRTVLSVDPDQDLEVVILTNGGDSTNNVLNAVLALTKAFYR